MPSTSTTANESRELIRVVVTGASGAYSRTLLAQLRIVRGMRVAVLLDLNLDLLSTSLLDIGFARTEFDVCHTAEEVLATVNGGRIALIDDFVICPPDAYDVLVEATGATRAGYGFAASAIDAGRHVVMVSKEVETVVGVHLAQRAAVAGVSYLPGRGDQPANLISLLDWVGMVGLEVVAAGKSSEHDLRFDPATGVARYDTQEIVSSHLAGLLQLGGTVADTLADRATAVRELDRVVTADACEMAVVSQYSGLIADGEMLHYPVARPDELADIYALEDDGGIISRAGRLDVFSMLRLPGEASFAGGEFVIVRTTDGPTWELLREKGHVVSRDGRYACIYNPYHFMGIETVLSVLAAVAGTMLTPAPRQHSVLAGRAKTALRAGTLLKVAGHNHDVDGVTAVLCDTDTLADDAVPFYLLDGVTLVRDIPEGALLSLGDLSGYDQTLLDGHRAGRALSR